MKKPLFLILSRVITTLILAVLCILYTNARQMQGVDGLETDELRSGLWTLCGRADDRKLLVNRSLGKDIQKNTKKGQTYTGSVGNNEQMVELTNISAEDLTTIEEEMNN